MSRRLRNTAIIAITALIVAFAALTPLRAFFAPTLVDIGTLGGSDAYTNGMNAYGQVVGASRIALDAEQHAFLWTPSSANGTTGAMIDLGKLGGVYSGANDVNDSGVVVGMTNMPSGGDRAYIWVPDVANGTTGTMSSIGVLGDGWSSEAYGINNSNHVVGWSYYSNVPATENDQHAFLWTPDSCGLGSMLDLGTLGGLNSIARAVNETNQVVGGSEAPDSGYNFHAFLWTPGGSDGVAGNPQMKDLGTLGGSESFASGINASGQVVGQSLLAGDAVTHAFLWTPGGTDGVAGNPQMKDLGAVVEGDSIAVAINDAGVITGGTMVDASSFHPFIWTPTVPNGTTGTMVDAIGLGGPGGYGSAINNVGQIAGLANLAGSPLPYGNEHAFISEVPTGNQAPTADADAIVVTKATNLTLTGSDPESSPLTFSIVSGPSFGTLTGTAPAVKYTPAKGYTGPDSFTFKVNDGTSDSAPATVSITVARGRQTPHARNDQAPLLSGETSISIDALANDDDPNGDPLTITAVTNGIYGNATIVNIGGVYTVNYTLAGPRPKKGTKDTVNYTISDGYLTETAKITITYK